MSTATDQPAFAGTTWNATFGRVLVGIDDSPESLEAARQAATLATGPLTLLAAHDPGYVVVGGAAGPAVFLNDEQSRAHAAEALERARQELATAPVGKIVAGRPWQALLDEIAREDNTLVAVGSHGSSRAKGFLIGSTATELLHKAPCSVLVARKPLKDFPGSIVVGSDGSKESATAEALAGEIAQRFDATLERYENLPDPVSALVNAAIEADLLVVGSRGLHGIKALGSVSERVAHEAACSVLVVR